MKQPPSSIPLLSKPPSSSIALLVKQAFSLFVLLLLLTSCEKPIQTDDEVANPQDGNLIVRVADNALSCTRLNFAVYDMSGTRVKQVNQQSSAADFGSAVFQIPPGDYQLVIVAHSSNGNPTMASSKKIQFTNTQGFTDTFLYDDTITVDDSHKELQVVPRRIVSLCRFVITDNYPADVNLMRFYYTGGSGAFDATTGLGCVNSRQDVKFDVSSGQREFDLYTFLHSDEGAIRLKVTALDVNGAEAYNREYDVSLKQNHITRCTSPYFSGDSMASATGLFDGFNGWEGEYYLNF